jgi:hypothetical protein
MYAFARKMVSGPGVPPFGLTARLDESQISQITLNVE